MEFQVILLLCFMIFSSSTINIFALPKEQELDRISALPGQPQVKFLQFSGYVTVNKRHGRALFYWLTEATSKADTKPLVLWFNGGPGCSSIGAGAAEEIGPFRINKTGSSLYLNKYSWNKEANILFVESPAGTGFSYTNTSSDLVTFGDRKLAHDNLVFVRRWMQRFPQYKHRDLYIAGESYGGHIVPQLALKIHQHNKKSSSPIINLKGFIVGNAATHNYYDNIGQVEYFWTHSLISDRSYKLIKKSCNFSEHAKVSKACEDIFTYMVDHELGNIDRYSIYSPTCKASQKTPKRRRMVKNTLLGRSFSGYGPCTENYSEIYFNRADVQKAMHANTTAIPHNWTECSDTLYENWKQTQFSMLPTYKKLMAAGLRIWVFSGDTDTVVSVTSTRLSLSHLHLKTKIPWYPWYTKDGEVGGWTEVYHGLTFATVRGAGHEVPKFEPARAFKLFQTFLAGKNLPPKP